MSREGKAPPPLLPSESFVPVALLMLRQLIQVENSARGLRRTELWLSGTAHAPHRSTQICCCDPLGCTNILNGQRVQDRSALTTSQLSAPSPTPLLPSSPRASLCAYNLFFGFPGQYRGGFLHPTC